MAGQGQAGGKQIMYTRDLISLIVFAAMLAVIYGWALLILLAGLIRWIRRRPAAPVKTWRRWTRRGILAVAIAGLLCLPYAYFVEPYWPQVAHVRLQTDKLPAGAAPIRIVQISDLHCEAAPRLEEKLPTIIAGLKPDLIVFTGDCINSPAGLLVFRKLMNDLSDVAPVYAVLGNWDCWRGQASQKFFEGTKVRELDGTNAPFGIRGARISLAGVRWNSDPECNARKIGDALAGIPPGDFSIFLCHKPDQIYDVADKVDLYLAGHTHGGQVAMPFYGAIITLSRHGKRFESGLNRVGSTWIYTNRGIGMEGDAYPRLRFFARPEITLIELKGK
ncbi:MAG: metallophosphoesterase family protein [Planctomycetes bacterium]|nr:metallophosphoesterase family protein [Planctomycetota bacterium]